MDTKKLYLFDFDGTIANSVLEVVQAFNAVGPKFGCKQVDPAVLSVILLGRAADLMKEYGLSRWKLPLLVFAVRWRLKSRLDAITAYPGVLSVMRGLRSSGHRVGILTSNSRANVQRFLARQGAEDAVDFVTSSLHVFGKHTVLKKILLTEKIRPDAVVYVGDEVRDIEAARRAGVGSVAVTWGFQPETVLRAAKPDRLMTSPEQLAQL